MERAPSARARQDDPGWGAARSTGRDNSWMSILSPQERALLLEAVDGRQPALRTLVDDLVAGERRLSADEGNAPRRGHI